MSIFILILDGDSDFFLIPLAFPGTGFVVVVVVGGSGDDGFLGCFILFLKPKQ